MAEYDYLVKIPYARSTELEKQQLLIELENHISIKTIALNHNRSIRGIEYAICRLISDLKCKNIKDDEIMIKNTYV